MSSVSLKLLVLKTQQVDKLRSFCEALGVELTEEKHGSGPVHCTGQVEEVVLEIYPLLDGGNSDTTTRLGFSVENLAEVVRALRQASVVIVSEPTQTPWGLRAVVRDPDERTVELYDKQSSQKA